MCLYFILSILTIEFSSQRNQAEREKIILTTAASQAQKQLKQLSYSEKQSAIYRHDLRHHIQFLQECIQQDHLEQAIEYMNDINDGLDNIIIKKYCTNEAVNLILSSYMEQADEQQSQQRFPLPPQTFPDFRSLICVAFWQMP